MVVARQDGRPGNCSATSDAIGAPRLGSPVLPIPEMTLLCSRRAERGRLAVFPSSAAGACIVA